MIQSSILLPVLTWWLALSLHTVENILHIFTTFGAASSLHCSRHCRVQHGKDRVALKFTNTHTRTCTRARTRARTHTHTRINTQMNCAIMATFSSDPRVVQGLMCCTMFSCSCLTTVYPETLRSNIEIFVWFMKGCLVEWLIIVMSNSTRQPLLYTWSAHTWLVRCPYEEDFKWLLGQI